MMRICLIVALVAGLAVAVLNFVTIREKVTTLVQDRNNERSMKEQAQNDLSNTRNELDKTTAKLTQTEQALSTATTERDAAVAEKDRQIKRANELAENLANTTKDRDDAKAELFRYTITGFTPEQLTTLAKDMKNLNDTIDVLNDEKKILERSYARATNELARYVIPNYHGPPLPAALKGRILVSDPKWDFVVLNVGEDQGVLEYSELLVNRNGVLVGKLRVRTVDKDRSIANLMPGWTRGDIMEGDEVIPAYPAS